MFLDTPNIYKLPNNAYLDIPTANARFFVKYLVQMIIETIVIVPWPIPPNTAYTIMKSTTLLGKKAAAKKLIAPNNAPATHNDLQPHISMNPATNIPTN